MKASKKGALGAHSMGGLFTFALISLFALLSLLLMVYGVRAYRGIAEASDQSGGARTALSYLSNKVRTGDEAGMVTLSDQSGVRLLSIAQEIDGARYETRIYCQGGKLYEQFAFAGLEFDPADGEFLLDANVDISWAGDNLISLAVDLGGGETAHTSIALRGRGEARR